MATNQAQWEKWFESVWADREDRAFREIFGPNDGRIHNLPAKVFEQMGLKTVDPRWLTHGVLQYPADANGDGLAVGASNISRTGWRKYITSGLSNPWGQDPATVSPEEYSGLGMELALFTADDPANDKWAISTLWWLMAIQILVATGQLEGELVAVFDRVPLGTSIDPSLPPSLVNSVFISEPQVISPGIQLASGKADILLCVGITDREMDFAKSQGGAALRQMLEHHEVWPVTDPHRVSTV